MLRANGEGRALAIAALLRIHPPYVVARMVRELDEGKSAADVTLGAYRAESAAPERKDLTEEGT